MSNPVEDFLDRGGIIHDGGVTIMGRTAYLQSIGYSADSKPLSITAQFTQGEWWRQQSGAWIAIADMTPGHRYNTAAMLMRAAHVHAFRFAWAFDGTVADHDGGEMAHDALERAAEEIWQQSGDDPQGWLRGTTLYRALTAGLTVQGDGSLPWQKTGRDPVTGEPTEVPPPMTRTCDLPACGCSGEAHP